MNRTVIVAVFFVLCFLCSLCVLPAARFLLTFGNSQKLQKEFSLDSPFYLTTIDFALLFLLPSAGTTACKMQSVRLRKF